MLLLAAHFPKVPLPPEPNASQEIKLKWLKELREFYIANHSAIQSIDSNLPQFENLDRNSNDNLLATPVSNNENTEVKPVLNNSFALKNQDQFFQELQNEFLTTRKEIPVPSTLFLKQETPKIELHQSELKYAKILNKEYSIMLLMQRPH
ncbi:MAG: hypothetical protein HWD61_06250 [Parachlamydiaceae bacterium]|nr:MAG: hypothetical protein HWD61_06250 [Parachlamydiaceae bacterium]